MNGGRHYSSGDAEGCLSEIGKAFLAVMIFGGCVMAVVIPYQLYFNQPTKVCTAWGDFPVIKEERNGFNTEKILVTEKVCTKWAEPAPTDRAVPPWSEVLKSEYGRRARP